MLQSELWHCIPDPEPVESIIFANWLLTVCGQGGRQAGKLASAGRQAQLLAHLALGLRMLGQEHVIDAAADLTHVTAHHI